ncbi:hypothetical protein EIP91_012330 [Steccherinum ochraceum]|uniref:Uncharacterized protein n=1 Tax=Steccherinum ochraceum TaxID=92696 RepID=A0A4R0RQ32_9APHY|nr:hypothetical protein EIP91_012330 [Steccherinum ochraceum]
MSESLVSSSDNFQKGTRIVAQVVASAAHDTVESLEAELVKLDNLRASVLARLNAFRPIEKLPAEILSYIFLCLIRRIRECREYWDPISPYGWLPVTYVCSRWRQVALSNSRLWAIISESNGKAGENLDRLRTFLDRSKDAPLDISIRRIVGVEDLNESIRMIIPEMGRAGALSMDIPHQTLSEIYPCLPMSIPHLLSLTLHIIPAYDPPIDDKAVTLNAFLSRCSSSSLQYLSAHSMHVEWQLGMFPRHLTHLHVHGDFSSLKTPTVNVIKVISCLTRLESISFADVFLHFPNDVESPPAVASLVHLPHLETLVLLEDALCCAHLLDHLVFPSSASIFLQFYDYFATKPVVSSLMPKILSGDQAVYADAKQSPVDFVSICSDHIGFHNRGCGHDDDLSWEHAAIERINPVNVFVDEWMLEEICARLPLRDTSKLRVGGLHLKDEAPWKRFFTESVPKVEDLCVRATHEEFLKFLIPTTPPLDSVTSASGTSQVLLPKLRRITLEWATFRESSELFKPSPILLALHAVLVVRRMAGAKVETVGIEHGSNIGADDIAILREVVEVEWDGKVDLLDSEPEEDDEEDEEDEDE